MFFLLNHVVSGSETFHFQPLSILFVGIVVQKYGSAEPRGWRTREAEDQLQPPVSLHEVQGAAQQARRRGLLRERQQPQVRRVPTPAHLSTVVFYPFSFVFPPSSPSRF